MAAWIPYPTLLVSLVCVSQTGAGAASVMDLETAGFYQPLTRQTRDAYEALLAEVRGQFGDQPQDVLKGAADEVLAVLKNDRLTVSALAAAAAPRGAAVSGGARGRPAR
jgi:hypothetical protein